MAMDPRRPASQMAPPPDGDPAQYAAMSLEGTVLYDQFADARQIAVELTDHYHAIDQNDPTKAEAWDRVVRQTETARQLLELWLRAGGFYGPLANAQEKSAVRSR
jgi:hypothetical protein